MPRYSPGYVNLENSRYGRGHPTTETSDSGFGDTGRGRGARKFANQERFGHFSATGGGGYGTNSRSSDDGVNNSYGSNRNFQSSDGFSGDRASRCEELIPLSREMIPRLIGKGGSTIKQVESDTGCRIQILKETQTDLQTDIKVSGSNEGVNAVKIYLEDQFGFSLDADRSMSSPKTSSYNPVVQPRRFESSSRGGFGNSERVRVSNQTQSNTFQISSWDSEEKVNGNRFENSSFGNWNEQREALPVHNSNFEDRNQSQPGFGVPRDGNSSTSRGFGSDTNNNRGFDSSRRDFGINKNEPSSTFGSTSGFSSTSFAANSSNFGDSSFGSTPSQFPANSGGFGSSETRNDRNSGFREGSSFGNSQSSSGGFGNQPINGSKSSRGFSDRNSFDANRTSGLSVFGADSRRRNDGDDFSVFSSKGNSTSRSTFGSSAQKESRFDWGPNGPPTGEKFEEAVKANDASAVPTIDWDAVRSCKPEARFKDYPDITKNFYHENPIVARRSDAEVSRIRESKNNIIVKDMSKSGSRKCPNPVTTFEEAFDPYPEILDTIYDQGFTEPSPIQCQGWPVLLGGDDLIGIAQTGSGKTLAFMLPALIHIDLQPVPRNERGGPNVLVLCPTRELALQIESEVKKYFYRGIKSVCVYGGGDRAKQVSICTDGVEIVIATPGRLYDLISNGIISIMSVTFVVLDEADRMLDLGFEPQILKCMLDVRPDRQTVMTSATWNWDVQRIAAKYLSDPFFVNVGSLDLTAVHSVTQNIIFAEDDEKEALLYEMIRAMQGEDKMIVFIGKKLVVDQIASKMALDAMPTESIHGGRDQFSRESAIEAFRDNEVRVLLATDVASRGLDIVDVTLVVNYDFPKNMEEYVHRVGRTGRAGRTGNAVSFISRRDWANARELIRILEEADQEVPDQLREMADRFDRRQQRMANEGGFGRRGGGGFGGRGGGGRGGGRRSRDDDLFCLGGSSGGFMPG